MIKKKSMKKIRLCKGVEILLSDSVRECCTREVPFMWNLDKALHLGMDLGEEEAQGVTVRGGTSLSCLEWSRSPGLGEAVVIDGLPE